jgi:hypothetical protein
VAWPTLHFSYGQHRFSFHNIVAIRVVIEPFQQRGKELANRRCLAALVPHLDQASSRP